MGSLETGKEAGMWENIPEKKQRWICEKKVRKLIYILALNEKNFPGDPRVEKQRQQVEEQVYRVLGDYILVGIRFRKDSVSLGFNMVNVTKSKAKDQLDAAIGEGNAEKVIEVMRKTQNYLIRLCIVTSRKIEDTGFVEITGETAKAAGFSIESAA